MNVFGQSTPAKCTFGQHHDTALSYRTVRLRRRRSHQRQSQPSVVDSQFSTSWHTTDASGEAFA